MVRSGAASVSFQHIGTRGRRWGDAEVRQWRAERAWRRSYQDEVVAVLRREVDARAAVFEVVEYGRLRYEDCGVAHPLYAFKSRDWRGDRPSAFVTGGVHGYETSGVQGALLFLSSGEAERYADRFNILVAPCVVRLARLAPANARPARRTTPPTRADRRPGG